MQRLRCSMEKIWDVEMKVRRCYLGWGKRKRWTSGDFFWPYSCFASNEEEAKQKAKKMYDDLNADLLTESIDVEYIYGKIRNWDEWTVHGAIERLNGKQFKQWAEQQGLSSFVKELV